MSDWLVLKFGGTSVASRERWDTIAGRARAARDEGLRPLIVCSAVSGMTNLLEALPGAALEGSAAPIVAEIRQRHDALAAELEIPLPDAVDALLTELGRIADGIGLVGECSPRVRARMLATGELCSTRMGAAFLATQGLDAGWLDARTVLRALPAENLSEARRWLSAGCDDAADPEAAARVSARSESVLVTQGFIAGDDAGQTVLLGRGGSDTSAAYFAAKLGAARCEIWTDVPGMFTADPRVIPGARLLRNLDYDEAQEIASTGAKVLHPRAVEPCRRHGIPLTIRCAPAPDMEGTTIARLPAGGAPQVKALSSKKKVSLVSMSTVGMWHSAGFLADVFAVFKRHGISIDLVSTSETNVTVTLDDTANALDGDTLEALADDLAPLCDVSVSQGVAAISLVGIGIRSMLHRLGGALERFEQEPIHLVSQAASDLNLTFVVDEEREARMLRRLHAQLFQATAVNDTFGPSWKQLFGTPSESSAPARPRWWRDRADDLLAEAERGTPAYIYDGASVRGAAQALRGLQSVDRVFYAMKANPHPGVLDIVTGEGLGLECVSPNELRAAHDKLRGDASNLLFTPNFAPRADYETAVALGAHVTIDALHPLEHWGDLFAGRELMLRVDIGLGKGHHDHVKTAGVRSKFGIDPAELERAKALVDGFGGKVVGLHAHSGSGIKTADAWQEVAGQLASYVELFPDVRFMDVGGGLAVPAKPSEAPIDLAEVDTHLAKVRAALALEELWIEPGRYLVAEAGVLLARVTQVKRKRGVTWVGVDAGMHSLIRPALYGAWHEIVNLTKLDAPAAGEVQVVGPICESGDVLGRSRQLPETEEGDVLLIATAGAYGHSMASNYNTRGTPREVIL